MTVASEIARIQGVKSNILDAIAAKGVTVPSGAMLADCPNLISSISGGGGGKFDITNIVPIVAVSKIYVVDNNGYIGYDITQYFHYTDTYYYNYAILDKSANFEESGLGQVTFYTPATNIIGGREYRTVVIGGKEWLAENLDYKFTSLNINPDGTPSVPSAWYYDRNESMYGIDGTYKCGLLYNWYAVKYLNDNRNTLCPGWHVPTETELTDLTTAVGNNPSTKLKALDNSATSGFPSGWNGTDYYGFGILPTGFYTAAYAEFRQIGDATLFWSVSEDSSSNGWSRYITNGPSVDAYSNNKLSGYSVRLVKDTQ